MRKLPMYVSLISALTVMGGSTPRAEACIYATGPIMLIPWEGVTPMNTHFRVAHSVPLKRSALVAGDGTQYELQLERELQDPHDAVPGGWSEYTIPEGMPEGNYTFVSDIAGSEGLPVGGTLHVAGDGTDLAFLQFSRMISYEALREPAILTDCDEEPAAGILKWQAPMVEDPGWMVELFERETGEILFRREAPTGVEIYEDGILESIGIEGQVCLSWRAVDAATFDEISGDFGCFANDSDVGIEPGGGGDDTPTMPPTTQEEETSTPGGDPSEPAPTAAPDHTSTPEPTVAPDHTSTPEPTVAPDRTSTPEPTAAPTPEPDDENPRGCGGGSHDEAAMVGVFMMGLGLRRQRRN